MNVYEIITNRIIDELKKGVVPWQKPWRTTAQKNYLSKKDYRGVNVLLLATQAKKSSYWATFRQIKKAGGAVRKGERGTPVVYTNWFKVKDKKTDEEKELPFLKYYTVFNLDQTEGLEVPDEEVKEVEPITACEQILGAIQQGPQIEHNSGGRAAYSPLSDRITIPRRELFTSAEAYYSTLFHELTHSTGHKTRLARKGVTEPSRFGSQKYSREELVAEIGAAFLCGQTGIVNSTIENSAAYIESWLQKLKNEKRLIVTASAQAQKAVDWIRG